MSEVRQRCRHMLQASSLAICWLCCAGQSCPRCDAVHTQLLVRSTELRREQLLQQCFTAGALVNKPNRVSAEHIGCTWALLKQCNSDCNCNC
jgi:hypothetical protein